MSSKDNKPSTSIALFQEKTVRRVWYQEKWYFSVIDVIAILTALANSIFEFKALDCTKWTKTGVFRAQIED
jgi:hypothetical protein